MTNEVTFSFDKQTYHINKAAQQWQQQLKKADVTVKHANELIFLKAEHPSLLPLTYVWEEDQIIFNYSVPKGALSFESLQTATELEQLRAASNLGKLVDLLKQPLTFFLHPENIVFDRNLLPYLAYRGIEEKMPPKTMQPEIFLRQYKAMIIALFQPKYDYVALYEGNLERAKGTKFIASIKAAESVCDIQAYLNDLYEEKTAQDRQNNVHVPRRKFRLYKQLTIWLCVVVAILAVPLSYYFFSKTPYQNKMLTSDTAFLKQDYETVIKTLEPVETAKIAATQKYELAYSFIQGKNLADTQKTNILNNISLKTNPESLDYWIENGRGNLDEALDLAIKLEEPDFILYGYQQLIEQVKNDTKLDSQAREEARNKYQEAYDQYKEKYEKAEEETKQTSEQSGTDASAKEAVKK